MYKGIVIGSHNKGKVREIKDVLSQLDIPVLSLSDVDVSLDVKETGASIGENATLKVEAYSRILSDYIVLSDDSGLEIEALNGEPGLHVRMWKGYRMEDEEIINYTLEQLDGVPQDQRGAQFRSIIALAIPGKEIRLFEGLLRGSILEKPQDIRMEGFPFDPLFYCEEWKLTLGEIHQMSKEECREKNIFTHRERALEKVKKYI